MLIQPGRLRTSVAWSMTGAILGRSLGLVASILTARMLDKDTFGKIGMIQSTVAMLVIVAGFGMALTTTKYIAKFHISDPNRAGRFIGMAFILSPCISLLLALIISCSAIFFGKNASLSFGISEILIYAAVLVTTASLNNVQNGIILGFGEFKLNAKISLYSGIVALPIIVIGAFTAALPGVVCGLMLASAFNCLLNYRCINKLCSDREVPVHFKGCFAEREVLTTFSIPSLISGLVVAPATWACNAILVSHESGFSEMASVNIGYQWRTVILFFPAAISGIILPFLSAMNDTDSPAEASQFLKNNVIATGIIASIVATGVALLSPLIMKMYGDRYVHTWPTLAIIGWSAVPMALANALSQAITSKGNMWVLVKMDFIWACAMLSFSFYFTSAHGAVGIAYAYLMSYILYFICQCIYMSRRVIARG